MTGKKHLLMRLRSLFLAAVFLLGTTVLPLFTSINSYAEEPGVILKLHYSRDDGNYAPWDVWLWPAGGEGAGYAFAEEDGEMVATMEVPAGVMSVGFIVRTQDWTKDIDKDQFIEIDEVVSGTVHAYVVSGVEGYKKVYGDDVVKGTKLKSVEYDGELAIKLTFTGELDAAGIESLKVSGNEGDEEIDSVEYSGDYIYMLKLVKKLKENRAYRLFYNGEAHKVNMPILFSTEKFEQDFTYTGDDLGFTYAKDKTVFRVWAPTADEVYLNLYKSGNSWESDLKESVAMTKDVNGTWVTTANGDLAGTYYTFTAVQDGAKSEACDPYARTTGYNGKRAMVIDLSTTNPDGWDADKNPHAGEGINEAVIYELHVRDFSVDKSSGIENKGKFVAFAEKGTKTAGGSATGIDYIKDLGVTHVQILPFYDYGSVDEVKTSAQFNWGYDPVNYNVPEGSYSTDAAHGEVRVKECKEMVKALHDNGLSVIMDVVYNHVYSAKDFCFNKLVPGYFSRINEKGAYSNGSGCGNDTASERSMVRKYIVDSVCYWANEYHIDGFRFDLVGLIDVDTVNEIVAEVHKTCPDVIFYGEGWVMNTDVTKEGIIMATQRSSARTPEFAFFNDNIRDCLKGSVFNEETGFVSGASGKESSMSDYFLSKMSWTKEPSQVINYASCHDNLSLHDRLAVSRPDADFDALVKMNNLTAAIYMTAEGVPFMQAGEEILRTKVKDDGSFDSNSYASSDAVNNLKWDTLDDERYMQVHDYYKGLIAFRKAHPVLRLSTSDDVKAYMQTVETGLDGVIAFMSAGGPSEEKAENIFLAFNASDKAAELDLPEGNWNVYVNGEAAGTAVLDSVEGKAVVAPVAAFIAVKEEKKAVGTDTGVGAKGGSADGSGDGRGVDRNGQKGDVVSKIAAGAGIAVLVFAVVRFLANRKRK